MTRRWTLDAAKILALAGVYWLAAEQGLRLATVSQSITLVWPPAGIALAALLLGGVRLWPGVALGALVANALTPGLPLAAAVGIACGNTLEAVVGATLLRRARLRPQLDRIAEPLKLFVLGAAVAPVLSATTGVASLLGFHVLEGERLAAAWGIWWIGDAMGILLVAPVFLTWLSRPDTEALGRGRWVELGALLAGVVAVSVATFLFAPSIGGSYRPQSYIAFPFLIWASLRLGPRGATLVSLAVAGVATWATYRGLGPFVAPTMNESLFLMQLFLAVVVMTGGALSAVVADRARVVEAERAARERLEAVQRELDLRVRDATAQLIEAERLAQLGSWSWDIAKNTLTWSAELYRIYGLEPASFEATFEAFLGRVHPDDLARTRAAVEQAFQTLQPFDFEHRIVRPNGEVRLLHALGHVVKGDDGAARYMYGTGQDITERKHADETRLRLEREQSARANAEEAIRARDDFLSIASHELKTPLTSLKLHVQSLLRDPAVQQMRSTTQKLSAVERQTARLGGLIETLLDVSRITSGRLALELESVDLAELVRDISAGVKDELARAGCTLHVEAPDSLVGTWDRLRLEQVVSNLLLNASKYGAGHPIEVVLTRRDEAARLSIRDHGIGIAPQDQARIFQRFERAVSSRHFAGIGLGLWIVRQVVEAMRGEVSVQSELGKGSEFTVTLPSR
jgi:PAS domain S-box-containing protein